MRSPTALKSERKTALEPVKCTPANSGWSKQTSVIGAGSPGTKLITPSGRPASRRIWKTNQLERIAVCDGFHTTVLPISAGAVGRLPPMAVKLNGVTA